MNREERLKYWQEHIKAYERSGITQSEYCSQNGLTRNCFRIWEKRLRTPDVKREPGAPPPRAFVALEIPKRKRASSSSDRISRPTTDVRFVLPGGVEFQTGGLPDPVWLRAVMAGVR